MGCQLRGTSRGLFLADGIRRRRLQPVLGGCRALDERAIVPRFALEGPFPFLGVDSGEAWICGAHSTEWNKYLNSTTTNESSVGALQGPNVQARVESVNPFAGVRPSVRRARGTIQLREQNLQNGLGGPPLSRYGTGPLILIRFEGSEVDTVLALRGRGA